jgi:hypothetical protein
MNHIEKLTRQNKLQSNQLAYLLDIIKDLRSYVMSDKFHGDHELAGYVNIVDVLNRTTTNDLPVELPVEPYRTKVVKVRNWDEWQVHVWVNGVRQNDQTYHTSDKQDAQDTAKAMELEFEVIQYAHQLVDEYDNNGRY